MVKYAREVFLLSLAAFFVSLAVATSYGAYTVFSKRGEWVGGIVHSVLTDKGKKDLDLAVITERVADKILSRVLANDKRLHVVPLIERLLDRILNRVVEKLMSNEGNILFKGLKSSGEMDRLLLKVTDHILVKRQKHVVQIVKRVAPIDTNRMAERVVSRALRRDKWHLIKVASVLLRSMTRRYRRNSGQKFATSLIDHVFVRHQRRITSILQNVVPVDLKRISARLVEQILERNRKDIVSIAQTLIQNLTRTVQKKDVERFSNKLLLRVLRYHQNDLVQIVKKSADIKLEQLLYSVIRRTLQRNKNQIIYILRGVLKVDIRELFAAPFKKKRK